MIRNKWARYLFNKEMKKNRQLENNMSDLISNCRSILLIYPQDKNLKDKVDSSQKLIFDFFGEIQVTSVHPELIAKEQLRWSGLPKTNFFMNTNKDFDIAIDLNMEFALISSYILSKYNVQLNIRLYKSEQAENLYQLSITNNSFDFKLRLENLLYYLGRLKKENICQV